MKPIAPILAVSIALLAACDAPPSPESAAATRGEVVYTAMQLPGGTEGAPTGSTACRVVFPVTYPSDVTPHVREIEIREVNPVTSIPFTSRGPVKLPYPSDHPNARRNADGTVTWRGPAFTFGPCRPTSWIMTIGKCLSGDCPPMRGEPSDRMGDIALEVRRRG